MKSLKSINRRQVLQGLGVGGAGAMFLGFQNCSQATFTAVNDPGLIGQSSVTVPGATPTPAPVCQRPLSIFDLPSAPALRMPARLTSVMGASTSVQSNSPNSQFYSVPFFDQVSQTQKTAYLLTVDVGLLNGSSVVYRAVASNDTNQLDIMSDVYVYDPSGTLLYWRRAGAGGDESMSAMILLDPALVASKAKLTVVVSNLLNGYYSQVVDLGQAPLAYSTAVAPFQAGVDFGGCTFARPYVSVDATGGQGNLGNIHAPHFYSVTNSVVQATLGQNGASTKHGEFAEDHYVAGAFLFDESGNMLSMWSEQSYAQAADHNLVFSGLDLAGRGVKGLRIVVLDTHNGYLQGFYPLVQSI